MASGIVEQDQNSQNSGQQQSGGTMTATSPASRSPLVQRLLDAPNLPAFINDLLTTQAVVVAGTEAAGFVLEAGENNTASLRPIAHIRPDASTAEVRAAALGAFQDLVKPCIEQNRDGAIQVAEGTEGNEAQFCLVTLLRNDGQVVAASAVITRCLNVERARQRLTSMQLVAGYFDLFTLRRNAEQARDIAQSHQYVLQYTTAVATAEGFESAAANLCNELATRTHSTRVSLGWVKGRNIKVKAISHTEEFDKKQELVVLLSKVMEECADQEAVVQYDPTGKGTDNVTRDAQQLSRTQGGHIVLSMPLRRQAEVIGVITCEFLPGTQITPQASNAPGDGGGPARAAALGPLPERPLADHQGRHQHPRGRQGHHRPQAHARQADRGGGRRRRPRGGAHPPDVPRQRAVQLHDRHPQYAVGALRGQAR